MIEEFAEYARKYGEIETKEEGREIIVPGTDSRRFSVLGDFISVSIIENESPEKASTIGIDCYRTTQKLRFAAHKAFAFYGDE